MNFFTEIVSQREHKNLIVDLTTSMSYNAEAVSWIFDSPCATLPCEHGSCRYTKEIHQSELEGKWDVGPGNNTRGQITHDYRNGN